MITYLATVHKVRSDCLDCQGVTQKTIKELLSNLKSGSSVCPMQRTGL
ncbi:MAG: hypothetical protein GPJ12_22390 [Microcystis aeruginosa S11-01]|nr:hypothetical protein [Microcystis aeruginosa S11-05]NCR51521.1 hypothetical protein [Microcystis aeruginosa S11-01]